MKAKEPPYEADAMPYCPNCGLVLQWHKTPANWSWRGVAIVSWYCWSCQWSSRRWAG